MSRLHRSLWRQHRGIACYAGVIRVGRVEWTSNGYWIGRTRVVGGTPNWKHTHLLDPTPKAVAEAIARHHSGGQRADRIGNARLTTAIDNIEVVIIGEHRWREARLDLARCSRVNVIVDRLWFDPLDELCRQDGPAELRVNPWTGGVSWWTTGARPYMLGCLLGLRPQPFEWDEIAIEVRS